jgi:DNA (cytosine-5)-methyltransferase 1
LFSGIGGFDLAAEWIGWTNVASCEIAEFPRKVLQYHFPNAYHHDDIHTLTYEKLNNELTKRFGINWRADDIILSGGFPCQPYSSAGKRQGKNDSRHLWPEMLRVIREVKPTWVVGENVYGLVNWNGGLVFDEVHTDLEAEGFEVQAFVLPVAGVNAPHRRDRVWFVAHTTGEQCSPCGTNQKIERSWSGNNDEPEIGSESSERPDRLSGLQWNAPNANSKGFQDGIERGATERAAFEEERAKSFDGHGPRDWANFPTTQPTIRRGDDGISERLDSISFPKWRNESIKAYGNAVVPQVVYQIFRAIQQYEENKVQQ